MADGNTKKQNNKKRILARYGVITFILFFLCFLIVIKMVQTTIVEAAKWNKRAEEELSRTEVIEPQRGSILAANGNILACNITVYDIRIDLRHPKFSSLDSKKWAALDQFADSLDVLYPRNKHLDNPDSLDKYSWRTLLHEQLSKPKKERKGTATIATRRPYEEFNRISKLPFMVDIEAKGRGFPIYVEPYSKRIYPFGDMARLSVGRVYEDSATKEIHGYAGLEKALDSLLYGKAGRARLVAMNAGMSNWVDVPAVNGYDVRSTIDIDIQDIAEAELLSMCSKSELDVEWGTCVVMEVKTGEIKAISNVERDKKGKWVEAMNRAVQPVEPGSVVKTISLMMAFEDGLVKNVSDGVDTSPFQGTTDPHAPSYKDMRSVLGWSSNTGIARVIFRGYSDDPSKYYDRLKSIGLFDPMHSGIGGEQTCRAKRIVSQDSKGRRITRTAQLLDLARQAYGYATEITPLYTLAYHNAIANDGKLVCPHIVRSLVLPDGRDSVIPIRVLKENVCSPATAKKMQECLLEPVWGKGTANALRDDRVKIAGKTGTVEPYDYKVLHKYDKSKRRISFCGYFPADNPKYSCIVVMELPAHRISAARGPGMVLLNIALKLYAKGLLSDAQMPLTSSGSNTAVLYGDNRDRTSEVVKGLDLKNPKQLKNDNASTVRGVVPDVVGLDAPSAIRVLEKAGYRTIISGRGYVSRQSVDAGTKLKPGSKVTIMLKL